MRMLNDYILVAEEFLTANECSVLRTYFDGRSREANHISGRYESDWRVKFDSLIVDSSVHEMEPLFDVVKKRINSLVKEYFSERNLVYFKKIGLSPFVLKRYSEGGRFDVHIDQADYETSARILAILIYLNENETGHTCFPDIELSVQPREGRILIFPPTLTYPHYGAEVVKGSKYLLQTYLMHIQEL